MSRDEALERLQRVLVSDLAKAITPQMGTLTVGMRSGGGREIPITVETLANGEFLLTDAGETWFDLVGAGCVALAPSKADRLRLDRLASLHRVEWREHPRCFAAQCTFREFTDSVLRLTAASIALDGWRAWSAPPEPYVPSARAVYREVVEEAPEAGWKAIEDASLQGRSTHSWPMPVLLRRDGKDVGVRVAHGSDDEVIERSIGVVIDTGTPLVVVAPPRFAMRVTSSIELRTNRIRVVPRVEHGTGKRVLSDAAHLTA
jgi:hypothetical protein